MKKTNIKKPVKTNEIAIYDGFTIVLYLEKIAHLDDIESMRDYIDRLRDFITYRILAKGAIIANCAHRWGNLKNVDTELFVNIDYLLSL